VINAPPRSQHGHRASERRSELKALKGQIRRLVDGGPHEANDVGLAVVPGAQRPRTAGADAAVVGRLLGLRAYRRRS
jgi:hypothetical protein